MSVPLNLKDIQSGFLSAATFNANNGLIEQALAKTLNRTSNAVDNAMEVDLDMGLNRIFNLGDGTDGNSAVNLDQVKNLITDASGIVVRLREDRKVASDGQQVFTMSGIKYVPGSNQLQVYVNGVAQVAGIDYSEVDTTTISFYTGLAAGDLVDMYVNESTSTNITGEVTLAADIYPSVADMVADPSLALGAIISTAGYYLPGDGGGNDYEIVAGGTGTADGGSFIDLDNGLQANGLFVDQELSVRQFGAKGDGVTNDYAAIKATVLSGYARIRIPGGIYFVGTDNYTAVPMDIYKTDGRALFVVPDNLKIEIDGRIIIEETGDTNTPSVFCLYESENATVSGGTFEVSQETSGRLLHTGVPVIAYKAKNCLIEGVKSYNTRSGCELISCTDSRIVDCHNKTDALTNKATVSFGSYGGVNCSIERCKSQYSTSDGNIGLFGSGNNNKILDCYATAFDENGNFDGIYTGQGIFVDSDQKSARVEGNIAKAFFYNIDVKTTIDNCIVTGNTVVFSKVGIAVRQGEGNEDVFGCSVYGNNIVLSNYPREEIATYSSYYPDTSKVFYGAGVLVTSVRGTVNVNDNSFYMDRAYGSNYTSEIIGIYCRATLAPDRNQSSMLNVIGNTFNFESILGATSFTNRAPVLLADTNNGGYLSINMTGNHIKYPDHSIPGIADKFGAIEVNVAESLIVTGNTFSRKVNFGSVAYAESIKNLDFSGNVFFEDCALPLRTAGADKVTCSGNKVYGGTSGSTLFRLDGSKKVICSGNAIGGGTPALMLSAPNAEDVVITGNIAETVSTGYTVSATATLVENSNIFII